MQTTNEPPAQLSEVKVKACTSCHGPISEKFCPRCGQAADLKRIDQQYVSHEVLHLLHFEKGFFYTAKELITRPGDSIREYINHNRARHMKPVAFLVLTSLLFTVVANILHVEDIYREKEKLDFGSSSVGPIMAWVQSHYGYANILSSLTYALCVKLFFRRQGYNLFEIIVLLCFVLGQAMLLLTVGAFFAGLLGKGGYLWVLLAVSFFYPTWAIGQFFGKRARSYVKSFFAFVLGYLAFYAAIIAVGLTVDVVVKVLGG